MLWIANSDIMSEEIAKDPNFMEGKIDESDSEFLLSVHLPQMNKWYQGTVDNRDEGEKFAPHNVHRWREKVSHKLRRYPSVEIFAKCPFIREGLKYNWIKKKTKRARHYSQFRS